MSDLRLPESSAGLDAAWLTKALRAGGLDTDGVITRFEAEVLGDAVGLMGEVVRLTLDWDPPDPMLPSSVVAKLPSTLEENRALGLSLGLYEAEHRFYGELSAAAAIRTPRCWFTGGDPGRGRYALLLEDVSAYERIDQLDGAPPERAEAAVVALADFHAHWWESERLTTLSWLPSGVGEGLRPFQDLVDASAGPFMSNRQDVLSDRDRTVVEGFVATFGGFIDESVDEPATLVHRDYRLDNMHFDAGEPVVFDWGGAARGGALYDLVYFLAGSMTIDDRRAHGDRLLSLYLDRIEAGGVDLTGVDVGRSQRINALFCLIVPIMAGGDTLNTRDDKGDRLVAEGLRRLFAYLDDIDAADVFP